MNFCTYDKSEFNDERIKNLSTENSLQNKILIRDEIYIVQSS